MLHFTCTHDFVIVFSPILLSLSPWDFHLTYSRSDSCKCAICHDILQDAVAFKECGHSLCDECSKPCLTSKSCPTCRVAITSTNPNYIVRELIELIEVKCPHGSCDAGSDGSAKRRRGNDGGTVTTLSSSDTCGWTGKCIDLPAHEKTCEFKVVTCTLDGCNHQCRRKDMNNHLSGGWLFTTYEFDEAINHRELRQEDEKHARTVQ